MQITSVFLGFLIANCVANGISHNVNTFFIFLQLLLIDHKYYQWAYQKSLPFNYPKLPNLRTNSDVLELAYGVRRINSPAGLDCYGKITLTTSANLQINSPENKFLQNW